MLGLSSPLVEILLGFEVGKDESRRGEPTCPTPSRIALLANMPEYREGLEEKGVFALLSDGVPWWEMVRR